MEAANLHIVWKSPMGNAQTLAPYCCG